MFDLRFKIFVSLLIFSMVPLSPSYGAPVIKNGVPCPKQGAKTVVNIKGVSKAYVCTTNPAAAENPNIAKGGRTWTLQTCVTYYASYKVNAKAIKDQRDLVNLMSEPDKTNYNKQLDQSQADLMKVVAAIENNHCKTGL
jgi:hypothetical protein